MKKIFLFIKTSENKKKLDKKGFTYLLSVSVFLVVIIAIFFSSNTYTKSDEYELYSIKIRTMNDFVKNFNTDVHRASSTSAFRALIALEDHVTTSGIYVNNVSAYFTEAFYNGTINGTTSVLMQNSTFKDYISKVQSISKKTGVDINAKVNNIELRQKDAWNVEVLIMIELNVSDPKNLAFWHIHEQFNTTVPIDNLRDPMYGVNTLNKIPNTVRRLNSTYLVNGSDVTNLNIHINGSYYLESEYAPTFLMRFEGRTDANPLGIESIVDIQSLSDQGLIVDSDAVKIDYIYFNNIATDKVCDVENIESDRFFVIPSNRADIYQIIGLNYSTSCP